MTYECPVKAEKALDKLYGDHYLSADMYDRLSDALGNVALYANVLHDTASAYRALGQIEGVLLTLVDYMTLSDDEASEFQQLAEAIIHEKEN